MSTDFAVPGGTQRPAPVTFAVYAQFGIGALGLLSAILGYVQTAQVMGGIKENLAGQDAEGVSADQVQGALGFVEVITYALTTVLLLFAVAVAVLGIFNQQGKNGTRIATWVLAGLGLFCGICGALGGVLGSVGGVGQAPAGDTNDPITEATIKATEDIPGWYGMASMVFTVLQVILFLAIIILLAVPASNDFFRKPKPAMDITLPPQAYMDAPPLPSATTAPPSTEAATGDKPAEASPNSDGDETGTAEGEDKPTDPKP